MLKKRKNKFGLGLILLAAIFLSVLSLSYAATPNPGHPWSQIGDGNFAVIGLTTPRVLTLPDADSTVLTNNNLVTVAQGGTGSSSLTGVLIGSGVDAVMVTTSPEGFLLGTSASQTLTGKTLLAASNVITDVSATLGDLFKFDGDRFVRFGLGSALQYLKTNDAATDLEWAGATSGPSGSEGEIQFNSGGSSWGASSSLSISNAVLHLDNTLILSTTTLPSTPTTGTMMIFNRQLAGRDFVKFRSDVAEDYSVLQPSIFQNNICLLWPNATPSISSFGCTVTVSASSAATASEVDGYTWRGTFNSTGKSVYTGAVFLRGTTSGGNNGFFYFVRATLPDATYTSNSGVRLFYGLSTANSDSGACVSDSVNQDAVGFYYSTALSANWRVLTDNSAAGNTFVDTGMPFTASTTYDFYIYSPPYPSTSTIYWRMDNLTTGTTTVDGTTNTQLPTPATFMTAQICGDSVNNTSRNWRMDTMYVEVPR